MARYRVLTVNDRYPYPLLLKLPHGVVGPGIRDLPDSMNFTDKVLTLIASQFDREIIPAGTTVPMRLRPTAGERVSLIGNIDPYSLAVRNIAILAAVYSGGATGEAEAAVAAEWEALDSEFLAARAAGSSEYTLAEFIADTQGNNSSYRMRERALARAKDAKGVSLLFDFIDFGECALAVARDARADARAASKDGLQKAVGRAENELFDKCFPGFAGAVVKDGAKEALAQLSGKTQAERAVEITKAVISQAKEIRPIVAAQVAQKLKERTGGFADFTHAQITAVASFTAGTLPDTSLKPDSTLSCPPPGPQPIPGAESQVRCRWVAHLDLTGNGKPDELVLWRSDTKRGAIAITDDAGARPLEATPQLEQGSIQPWSSGLSPVSDFPGSLDSATPQRILRTATGRDIVTISTYEGAHGPDTWVLGLDTAGRLAFIANGSDPAYAFTFAWYAGTPARCLTEAVTFTPPMQATC